MPEPDTHTYDIAAVGSEEVVSLFKLLGAHVYPVHDASEVLETVRELKKNAQAGENPLATIIITEDLFSALAEHEKEEVRDGVLPAVCVIPGPRGAQGEGGERLRELTQRAIGSDIAL